MTDTDDTVTFLSWKVPTQYETVFTAAQDRPRFGPQGRDQRWAADRPCSRSCPAPAATLPTNCPNRLVESLSISDRQRTRRTLPCERCRTCSPRKESRRKNSACRLTP